MEGIQAENCLLRVKVSEIGQLSKKIEDLQAENSSLNTKVAELQEKVVTSSSLVNAAENTFEKRVGRVAETGSKL